MSTPITSRQQTVSALVKRPNPHPKSRADPNVSGHPRAKSLSLNLPTSSEPVEKNSSGLHLPNWRGGSDSTAHIGSSAPKSSQLRRCSARLIQAFNLFLTPRHAHPDNRGLRQGFRSGVWNTRPRNITNELASPTKYVYMCLCDIASKQAHRSPAKRTDEMSSEVTQRIAMEF